MVVTGKIKAGNYVVNLVETPVGFSQYLTDITLTAANSNESNTDRVSCLF